jgi:D-alanyl-D-alanine carboxypeptidase
MTLSPLTKHQQVYLLGACAVVLVAVVVLIKSGVLHHNELMYSGSGIASSETTSASTTAGSGVNIPPIASSTLKASAPANTAKTTTTTKTASTGAVAASDPLSSVTATSYLVGNLATGQIYYSKDPTLENGLASISKLFTAIVAEQNMDPNQIIQITPAMLAVYPNSYGILLGEKFTLHDLLYGMLLQSNDNIAEGIAMAYSSPSTYISAPAGTTPSESAFIAKMNTLAASLNLTHTHFIDASGLDEGNVTDANDLFSFAQYLYKNQQPLLGITDTYSYEVATSTDHLGHDFINIDPFVGDPHYIGGKTGRTDEAGETMLSMFNYESDGVNYPIVVIVLHSDMLERQNDTSELYEQTMDLIDKQG